MEKIKPLLLLLLLLIFFCTWQKMDEITLSSHAVSSNALEKKAIDFVIKQAPHHYSLNGHFTHSEQPAHLGKLFELQEGKLLLDDTSTDETLAAKGSIPLARELIPLFVKEYQDGVLSYTNETLIIDGVVRSQEIKEKVENILASSSLAFKNHTKVVVPTPINFLIHHTGEKNDLSGTFTDKTQEEVLQKLFTTLHAPLAISQISEDSNLVDLGSIPIVTKILPVFVQNYTEGEIYYQNSLLTVKGKVKDEVSLKEMESLLSDAKIPVNNLSTLDQAYLQKIADDKRAEEEAKLAEENRKLLEEKERLEQEAAEQAKLEEERKQEEALKAQADKEAAAQAKLEEAAKARALQEEAKLAKEAAAQKLLQEKEAKANIIKLLQVENIEFNTGKSTLTNRGKNTVDKLASILKKYPEIKIEIAGFTDSDGTALFNQELSQARVDTISKELVSQGITTERLLAKGYGESKPLVPNTTDENKQKNRRVEINIIGE
jgi:outer membrane protein OmpA-like peptidoglycan-associated protein